MGRKPCCNKGQVNKGAWSIEEDQILVDYIKLHGEGNWRHLPLKAGLNRCGKSCRLRWMNYLRPNIKRGGISEDEEELIVKLHKLLGNRWSLIAGRLPGRTDNEIKNYWNTILRKKIQGVKNPTRASKSTRIPLMGLDPNEAHQLNETKEIIHMTNVNVPQESLVRTNEELKTELNTDNLHLSESPGSERNLEITNDQNEDNKVMGGDFVSLNHHLCSPESHTNLENEGGIGGVQFFEELTDISEKWDDSGCDLTSLFDSGFNLESLEKLLLSDEE